MTKHILKKKLVKFLLCKKIEEFYRDESGVYGMITILLSAVIIGYVTFVVDGTGILFDKVRFTQGLQQAGLFLTAEDNRFRDNQDIVGVNNQPSYPSNGIPPMPAPFTQNPPVFRDLIHSGHYGYDDNGWPTWLCPVGSSYESCKQNYDNMRKHYRWQRDSWNDFSDYYNNEYGPALQRYQEAKDKYDNAIIAHNNAVVASKNFKDFELHAKNVGIPLKGCSESKTDPDAFKQCNLEFKEYERNIQMVASVVRSYYLPDTYKNYTDTGKPENNYNIKDDFYYHCDHVMKDGSLTNDVACVVDGGFERPSWLYWGNKFKKDYGLSFGQTQKIAVDNTVYIGKSRANIPVDIMFVDDFSSSMYDKICTRGSSECDTTDNKITVLRRVVGKLAKAMITPPIGVNAPKNYNRIGFVDFGYGAQLIDNPAQCTLPYVYDQDKSHPIGNPVYSGEQQNKNFCDNIETQIQDVKSAVSNDQTALNNSQEAINNTKQEIAQYQNKLEQCQSAYYKCKRKKENKIRNKIDELNNSLTEGYYVKHYGWQPSLNDQLKNATNKLSQDQKTLQTLQDKKKKMCIYRQEYDGKLNYFETLSMVDKLNGEPLADNLGKTFFSFNKRGRCLRQSGAQIQPETSKIWFYGNTEGDLQRFNDAFSKINPEGYTLVSSGLIIGANLLMQKNEEAKASDIKSNTKRFIVVLSDGQDQKAIDGLDTKVPFISDGGQASDQYSFNYMTQGNNANSNNSYITRTLMDPAKYLNLSLTKEKLHPVIYADGSEIPQGIDGICTRIRNRLDSLNVDKNYGNYPAKISFIAIGYDPTTSTDPDQNEQYQAWLKCVGKKNYYVARDEGELFNALRSATGLNEEVGKITDKRPVFDNNTDPLANSPVVSSSSSSGLENTSHSGSSSSSDNIPDGAVPPGQGSTFNPAGVSPL